eukprot:2798632-Prorocentrum_lima.AAC.1
MAQGRGHRPRFCQAHDAIHQAAAAAETFPTPSLECGVEDVDGEPVGGASLGELRDACDFLHLGL